MDVTYYVALPFVMADDGLAPGEAVECLSANAAVMRAEALSRKPGCAGAVAFSRTGDPSSGDFGDAKVIRKFGEVPDDLSTLRRTAASVHSSLGPAASLGSSRFSAVSIWASSAWISSRSFGRQIRRICGSA